MLLRIWFWSWKLFEISKVHLSVQYDIEEWFETFPRLSILILIVKFSTNCLKSENYEILPSFSFNLCLFAIVSRKYVASSRRSFLKKHDYPASSPSWMVEEVSRWKSSRFSGVFHRRRQVLEFLPPLGRGSTFTSHWSFRRRFPGETSAPPRQTSCWNQRSGRVERCRVVYQKENVG